MAIIHCQSAGWLLDHLFFINQSGYQLCHTHEHYSGTFFDASAFSDKDPVVATTPVNSDSCKKRSASEHGTAGKKSDEMLQKTYYLFREEFFSVFKPHIAADFQKELQQWNSEVGLEDKGSEQQEGAESGNTHSEAAKKKRKRRSSVLNHGERDALEYHLRIKKMISEGTRSLVQEGLKSGFLQPSSAKLICSRTHDTRHSDFSLAELCEMAKQYLFVNETEESIVCKLNEDISVPEQVQLSRVTENVTNDTKLITLMGHKYLFPPKSSFLLSDISCMQPLLNYNKKFGVIVIDPPWENKSVKRSNRYSYLPSWQIKQIPVPALAAPGCLVVTWVTNRQKHLRFVKDELYPLWAVHGVVEWYWVKITRSGEFVFPLESPHKKPYEILVLGRIQGSTAMTLRISGDQALPIPDHKLIVSVPSTLHSHKPPLTEILKEYTRPDVECLELFARNLQPGWTSWGNEVIKFQHMDYFTAE
ncbi:N(6)-adenine-specific methyltransferase METTL4 [Heteronotia binoei]|uniref:N(6)-adenine-specific methyltransferase METTL4 n=1 Tax=Heteronotia binoei TaxID=13085 RepID=UPI00292FDDFA|nr:N(6)-adenine-specific methyltransferase METTL4 [Heteronotia binoei]